MFLGELSTDDLRLIYTSIFRRTAKYEESVDKDVMDLGLDECVDLLTFMNPKSITSIEAYKSQFRKYTAWGINKGLSVNRQNYWTIISSDSDIVKISYQKRYVKNIDELVSIVETSLNAPYDKYVVYLLYMGIMGENCIEISLLKDEDIDQIQKTITTSRRKYNIIEPLYELIVNPGHWDEKKTRDDNSPYFVKPFKSKKLDGLPVSTQYLQRVFFKLNEAYFQNTGEKRFYVPMTIWRSGMFNMLYGIEKTKGILINDDFLYVCGIYGKKTDPSGLHSVAREYEVYRATFYE